MESNVYATILEKRKALADKKAGIESPRTLK